MEQYIVFWESGGFDYFLGTFNTKEEAVMAIIDEMQIAEPLKSNVFRVAPELLELSKNEIIQLLKKDEREDNHIISIIESKFGFIIKEYQVGKFDPINSRYHKWYYSNY